MPAKFRKRIKIIDGIHLNFSKNGYSSLSIGGHGLTTNVGKTGTRTTLGLPGTGLSYSLFSKTSVKEQRSTNKHYKKLEDEDKRKRKQERVYARKHKEQETRDRKRERENARRERMYKERRAEKIKQDEIENVLERLEDLELNLNLYERILETSPADIWDTYETSTIKEINQDFEDQIKVEYKKIDKCKIIQNELDNFVIVNFENSSLKSLDLFRVWDYKKYGINVFDPSTWHIPETIEFRVSHETPNKDFIDSLWGGPVIYLPSGKNLYMGEHLSCQNNTSFKLNSNSMLANNSVSKLNNPASIQTLRSINQYRYLLLFLSLFFAATSFVFKGDTSIFVSFFTMGIICGILVSPLFYGNVTDKILFTRNFFYLFRKTNLSKTWNDGLNKKITNIENEISEIQAAITGLKEHRRSVVESFKSKVINDFNDCHLNSPQRLDETFSIALSNVPIDKKKIIASVIENDSLMIIITFPSVEKMIENRILTPGGKVSKIVKPKDQCTEEFFISVNNLLFFISTEVLLFYPKISGVKIIAVTKRTEIEPILMLDVKRGDLEKLVDFDNGIEALDEIEHVINIEKDGYLNKIEINDPDFLELLDAKVE